MKALKDNVIVEFDKSVNELVNNNFGIHVVDRLKKNDMTIATVISKGKNVDDVEIGNKVFLRPNDGIRFNDLTRIVHKDLIEMVIDE